MKDVDLRAVMDGVPVLIGYIDSSFHYRFANKAYREWFGLQEIEGKSTGEVLGEATAAVIRPHLERALKGERVAYDATLPYRTGTRHVRVHYTPDASGGAIGGVFVMVDDISDLKAARELLDREKRNAEEKSRQLELSNKELEQFAYVASHDLQEPLRKILAFSERLKERKIEGMGELELDYFERMQGAARRMKVLIEDLLNFSRVTTKESPLERMELGPVITEVLNDLEARIAPLKASIEVRGLPPVHANPLQMRQLFQNLVGNALKFAKKDVAPRIEIYASPAPDAPGSVDVHVRDNGIGFDEKYVDRIFKPFQKLHSRGEYEGTGIGLAICFKIAQRHGGRLTAVSRPGEGSTFTVRLLSAAS